MTKVALHFSVLFLMMAASVEVATLLLYHSGLVLRNPLYRSGDKPCDDCPMNLYHPELGWDYTAARSTPPNQTQLPVCGAAYGNSFTRAEEVEDHEAWPFILSTLLRCKVENFGVGGYDQGQAYLKYLAHKSDGDFVIIGLMSEMLRRNFATSWRYYAGVSRALPKPIFRLVNGDLALEANPPPNPRAIEKHQRLDRFAAPYLVEFPYSLSLIRILYYRIFKSAYRLNRMEGDDLWNTAEAMELSKALIARFVRDVESNGQRVVVLLHPTPDWVVAGHRPYLDYMKWIVDAFPGVCVIDPFPELERESKSGTSLIAPKHHFNKAGNEVLAQVVFREIDQRCFPDREDVWINLKGKSSNPPTNK